MREGGRRRLAWIAAALAVALGVTAALLARNGDEPGLAVQVLSGRADLVSGGDALLEIVLPRDGQVPAGLTVTVDGRDVTAAFAVRPDGRFLGLVDDLRQARNVVRVAAPEIRGAGMELTNHGSGGPIFAGEQVQPWRCATRANGLGPARDAQCSTPPVYELLYRPVGSDDFLAYDPDDPPPDAQVQTTTTDEDHTVPYIVRRERGVIDRGIYDIAVLYDPAEDWSPWQPQRGWNRKVYWTFGGSCQPYHAQEPPDGRPDRPPSPGALIDHALARGFAVASSAMNVLGSNCNTVVSAEALMMVKEHLLETYGPARYTFGFGGSGGAIQVLQVAEAYPGLLDGVISRSTFADLLTTATENFDCRLLSHYVRVTSPQLWDETSAQALLGDGAPSTCDAWIRVFGFPAMLGDPTLGCTVPLRSFTERDPGGIRRTQPEAEWVYHPRRNPDGVRCTIFDYAAEIFGRRADGVAHRPYDNVGVQYGLRALLDGRITAEQYVDLNARIGSLDLDYRFQPSRVAAAEPALAAAYRSGQVVSGTGLGQVPVLDASYAPPAARIHSSHHSWKLRERLIAANGSADNHVIRVGAGERELFRLMDRWLARLEADTGPGTPLERIARTKPKRAVDSGTPDGTTPRMRAGAPLRDDILKCRLMPLDRTDYAPVAFTDGQWRRLQSVFPDGVCDWSQPGVGQTTTVPWATYAGEGLAPLGPPPRSEPLE